MEQLFELFRGGLGSGNAEGASEPVGAIANLDWRGVGTDLGGDVCRCLLDPDATSTCEGSGSCVGGKGSLDLFHEAGFHLAGLGHDGSIAVEVMEGLEGFERWEGCEAVRFLLEV
jgi:hypothetical protein